LDEWVANSEFPLEVKEKREVLDKIADAEDSLFEVDLNSRRAVNRLVGTAELLRDEIE
jgi:hypothetical protein